MIAAYTARMMRELREQGWTSHEISGSVTSSIARSRLYNAARRAKLPIVTNQKSDYDLKRRYMVAYVKEVPVPVTRVLPGSVLENGWTVRDVYMNRIFGVVLAEHPATESKPSEYATWAFRVDQQATFWGHYFVMELDGNNDKLREDAVEDFLTRVRGEVSRR